MVTDRGVAVFFERDPEPWLPWKAHLVRVTKPDGTTFAAVADVEFARKVPPGEVMTLLFQKQNVSDIPVGSRVAIVGLSDG
jgi:hypothetical protein